MLNSCDELQCGARGVLYIVATPLVWSGCPEFSQVNERKKKLPVFFFFFFFWGGGGGGGRFYFSLFFFFFFFFGGGGGSGIHVFSLFFLHDNFIDLKFWTPICLSRITLKKLTLQFLLHIFRNQGCLNFNILCQFWLAGIFLQFEVIYFP